jgi:iron complex outermembrane recepter protein
VRIPASVFRLLACLALLLPSAALARPVQFDLPAQPLARALLAFAEQAGVDVLFSYQDVEPHLSNAVTGRYEAEEALGLLLRQTGFVARRNLRGKFVVTAAPRPPGAIHGQLLDPSGVPLPEARVMLPTLRRTTVTDTDGRFRLEGIPAGTHRLMVTAAGHRTASLHEVVVEPGQTTAMPAYALEGWLEPGRLAPFLVEEQAEERRPFDRPQSPPAPRTAAGNLDLRRTESDVLPYTLITRDRIVRSGSVDLNQFLQRELLEGDGAPAQGGGAAFSRTGLGGGNLAMRGFGADETVLLVNGRRLPEVLMIGDQESTRLPADVSFIPLSLVQRVDVLPASASALYTGNAVGGVINIVLRPDVDVNATEVTTTYTNALHGYDAPSGNVSFMHGRSFLNGALRVRLNGNFTFAHPPTEAELGYRRSRREPDVGPGEPLFRATPNVRSADGSSLFGPGTSSLTFVPPGADGSSNLEALRARQGHRNYELFDGRAGLSTSLDSVDLAYGRAQKRTSWFTSTVYDVTPWLQLGFDGIYSHSTLNRGYELFRGDLLLGAESPFNPFGQDVRVSLNESALELGERYNETRIDFATAVFGALLRLPAEWRVLLDSQVARNTVRRRGLEEVDLRRWQHLVDTGRYNPLRDTQLHPAPRDFYDEVLVYSGPPGEFVTLGEYSTWDSAIRLTHENLRLPTGEGLINLGGDYRWTRMADAEEQFYYGEGVRAGDRRQWRGRTLERVSAFGELQAPLLPAAWLPRAFSKADVELAARYVTADTSQETNFAPTYGVRFDFTNGFSLRGSITTSNRYPTPQMARQVGTGSGVGGSNIALISDPRRGETYDVRYREIINHDLRPEEAVTQTAGLSFQRGVIHRLRASLDYFDTRKNNESIYLSDPDTVVNLEEYWPEWVERAPPAAGEQVGRVSSVTIGRVNAAWRHSSNWTASVSYAWDGLLGGTWESYVRWVHFSRFDLQYYPTDPVIDQLRDPDGTIAGLLPDRANFGSAWSNRNYGFGFDGRYYASRRVPANARALQGADRIDPHWQFDVYTHANLKRWLPWQDSRYGLRAQLRINNVFGPGFPYYWATGALPYGDWRGRTYSLSITAIF